jgi:hypothetical protein
MGIVENVRLVVRPAWSSSRGLANHALIPQQIRIMRHMFAPAIMV